MTSRFDRLSWSERKEAKRIATEMLRIHKQDPECLRVDLDQLIVATIIHHFDGQYVSKSRYDLILKNEDIETNKTDE